MGPDKSGDEVDVVFLHQLVSFLLSDLRFEPVIFEDDFDSKFVKNGDNRAEAVHNCAVQILKSQP